MKELKDLLDDFMDELETNMTVYEIEEEIRRGQTVPRQSHFWQNCL